MQKINLLPPEYQSNYSGAVVRGLKVGLVLAVVLALVVSYAGFLYHMESTRQQLAETEAQVKKLNPILKRIENLQKIKQEADTKSALLNKLVHGRLLWSKNLLETNAKLPKDMWLTELSVTQEGLVIKGWGTSFSSVGVFILHLKNLSYFSEVDLKNVVEKELNTTKVVRFEIICRLAGGGGK